MGLFLKGFGWYMVVCEVSEIDEEKKKN